MWPFKRSEARSQPGGGDYTDAVVQAVLQRASADAAVDAGAVASVEAASGIVARALSMADVMPAGGRTAALDAATLALAGRELVRRGECLFRLEIVSGSVQCVPVAHWDVRGVEPDPMTWWYRADLAAPDYTGTVDLRGSEVLHLKWNTDPREPWRGIGPLQAANLTAAVLAKVEGGLRDETSLPSGAVIPMGGTPTQREQAFGAVSEQVDPITGAPSPDAGIRGKLKAVPGEGGNAWASGGASVAAKVGGAWQQQRLGPEPPSSLVELRRDVALAVFVACGIPRELAAQAEGTASREAWRRFLHGSIQPLADNLAVECGRKLGVPVSFSFDRLFASDLSGRARAFGSLVQGGMDVEKAATLSGLMEGE